MIPVVKQEGKIEQRKLPLKMRLYFVRNKVLAYALVIMSVAFIVLLVILKPDSNILCLNRLEVNRFGFNTEFDSKISFLSNNIIENLNKSREFKQFFEEIFLISEKQQAIDKNVLIKTIKFMLQEPDEYDPELVAFVKTLFINIERRTERKVGDTSQTGQSTYIDKLLNGKRDGFYIEAGAHNGEFVSNSMFFEFNRNWTGLLIEPTPEFFKDLRKADRSATILNACIAKKHPMVAKFRVWSGITGRESEMSDMHKKRLDVESRSENKDKSQTIYVPCFSLNTIMHALGVSRVDFFSLDIEGGEYDVVKSIDYKKLDITTFAIEYSANYETKDLIANHLFNHSYKMTLDDKQDYFFMKKP